MTSSPRKADARVNPISVLGIIALVCGALALSGIVVERMCGPFTPKPSLTERIVNDVTRIEGAVVATVTGANVAEPKVEKVTDIDLLIEQGSVLFSLLGILASIIAYVRREQTRVVVGSLVLSGFAFSVHYVLVTALVIAVVLLGALFFCS